MAAPESTRGGPAPGAALATSGAAVAGSSGLTTSSEAKSISENLRVIGGLLALASGLVALVVIVLVGMEDLAQEQAGAVATGGVTAIATMVGAYFGVKVGSDGTKEAIKGQKEEAAKAQAFALAADASQLPVIQKLLNGEATQGEPPLSPPATSHAPEGTATQGDVGF
jgi:hypothetical protein